jgi:hypothetical protein
MRYESATVKMPMDEAPENWRQATRPGAVFFVALDEPGDGEARGLPLWGGLVIRRTRKIGEGVALTLATGEAYFDRVYVGDVDFFNHAQNLLVKFLVETYAKSGAKRGLPIRVQVMGGNGVARSRSYRDSEDKTLYSVLSDLSGVLGGPEWTVGWEWVDSQRLGLVLYVGDRIGSRAPAGLGPAAQFNLPGDVTEAELVEGFGADEGANDVMATSSGTEGARPQSPRQTITTDFRPRFEYRWTPSTSITSIDTLTSHAQRALAAIKDGTVALTLTANRGDAPQLGREWRLGDDIGFDITAPEFPDGLTGTARAVGWELTDTQITPLVDVTAVKGVD